MCDGKMVGTPVTQMLGRRFLFVILCFFFFQFNSTIIKRIFQVNLTAVILKEGGDVVNSPRIDPNSRLLEVVIAQPNQTVGEVNFDVSSLLDPATQTIQLDEDIEMLNITVQRTGSSLSGEVGFRYIARPLRSSSYSAADHADFSPSEGKVMFASGENRVTFEINITDDDIPEIEEGFYVQMSRPLGGVRIGQDNKVDVIIKPNDKPYGRFGYVIWFINYDRVIPYLLFKWWRSFSQKCGFPCTMEP